MRFTIHTALAQTGSGTGSVRSPPCDVDPANVRKNPITTFVSTCAVKFSAFSTMNDSQNLSHPEIEFRPSFLTYLPASSPPRETLLDLLEVYPDRINLKPKLDHSSLIDYFSVSICAFLPTFSRCTQSWFDVQEKDAAKQDNPQPLRILCVASFVTPCSSTSNEPAASSMNSILLIHSTCIVNQILN